MSQNRYFQVLQSNKSYAFHKIPYNGPNTISKISFPLTSSKCYRFDTDNIISEDKKFESVHKDISHSRITPYPVAVNPFSVSSIFFNIKKTRCPWSRFSTQSSVNESPAGSIKADMGGGNHTLWLNPSHLYYPIISDNGFNYG